MAGRARAWDWVVASTMVVVGLVLQLFTSALIATPIVLGLDSGLGVKGTWVFIATWALVLVLLNVAGFLDYYKFRRVNRAGAFHLIPRAIERIRTGQEFPGRLYGGYGGLYDAYSHQPIDVQGPIRVRRRLIWGIVIILASAAAFFFGATGRSMLGSVAAAAGMIFFVVGVSLVGQALLAQAGFIKKVK